MSEFQPIILPYGLTIHRVLVQSDGRTHDIVIGPESPTDHVTQKYTNTIVGRYANRIPVGTHILERKGINSQLHALSNESPEVSLHGGPIGFDSLPWTLLSLESPPELFSTAELARLRALPTSSYSIFRLESPAGDQGFPGSLKIEVCIAIIGPENPSTDKADGDDPEPEPYLGSITIVYRAKLETSGTVTPVNLTQHWGFNLDASLQDGPEPVSVKDHELTIKADHIAELAPNSLGTGSFIAVSTLPAHAHTSKRIGHNMPSSGYDDYYLLRENARSSIPTRIPLTSFLAETDLLKDVLRASDDKERGSRPDPLVILSSKKSGLALELDSNQNGVMFYSNAMGNMAKGARKIIHGGSGISGNGDAYGPQTAVFLEFHHPLAAFLYPENKDAEDTLLTSDELYNNYVRCDIKIKSSAAA
ncbi:galactose mutarotase-like domain-containing protein [Gymnopilus junonius]|uniref:Galactose mutarotase-like domain-containing protein n=1 Tax=Gymnopilus junonius TaxID=109634 RepID=A0A9P5NZR5_GYMJU|nr:galactose mutarotase-like domain-containing protein [Gymnopilus junonius]